MLNGWSSDPLEDVINFFVTIGSPALAAYSLQITYLNASWISRAFMDVHYPNSRAISTVLSALQHVPIRVSLTGALLPSLIVLPQNDEYWELLLEGAEKTHRWSIPLAVGFVWVGLATLLTLIDSLEAPHTGVVGYSMVANWAYLLPLIVGWVYIGSQPEPNHLRECLDRANRIADVATSLRDKLDRAKDVDGQQTRGIELSKRDQVDRARMDEMKTVPVFNYARAFIWSLYAQHFLSLAKTAAANARQQIPVDNYGHGRGATWVVGGELSVARENRIGTEEQVIRYCTATIAPFEKGSGAQSPVISPSPTSHHSSSTLDASLSFYNTGLDISQQSRWAPGIWRRTILAALLALGLQWGSTMAAIVIYYWAPPVGLGCQSLPFLLYGILSTTSMLLCIASSILAHASRPRRGPEYWVSRSQTCLDWGAILCGYLGKGLAFASGIGILLVCFFHASGTLMNCFCSSTTFGRGVSDVFLVTINYTVDSAIGRNWIIGLALASSTVALFAFSLWLGKPPRR